MALTEFEIIRRFFNDFGEGEGVLLGPGDDCAILRPRVGEDICVSTDTLVNGVHFPKGCDPEVIAWRSLAVNLSDLAAMGADPLALTMALTLAEADEVWLTAFSRKLKDCVTLFDCPLVGGNLARGPLSITVQVIGTTPSGEALRRSGARAGDDIYVSGTLGDAAMGLSLYADSEMLRDGLVSRYCFPQPRLALARTLRGLASSAVDISDGLVADLGHICEQSCVSASINTDLLPLSDELLAATPRQDAIPLALYGGDDYELCFTAPESSRSALASLDDITRIGSIVADNSSSVMNIEGQLLEKGLSYDHFA